MHPRVRPPGPLYPSLPIVTPDPPERRSESERFGALFYLGIAGLFVMAGLIGWFGWSAWSMRTVWSNVYVIHDDSRSDIERIQAAYDLTRDPRVNARQLWDIALGRTLPPQARYLVAEALSAAAVEADPRGYILAVSRSEGWPGWLRVLLTRPIAYEAAHGSRLPGTALAELSQNSDPAIVAWARFAQAAGGDQNAEASLRAEAAASADSLARQLTEALDLQTPEDRVQALDRATLWLRDHHPDARDLWSGWEIVNGRVTPTMKAKP